MREELATRSWSHATGLHQTLQEAAEELMPWSVSVAHSWVVPVSGQAAPHSFGISLRFIAFPSYPKHFFCSFFPIPMSQCALLTSQFPVIHTVVVVLAPDIL